MLSRQSAMLPVVHNQQHVSAMLGGAQVPGIGKIIRHVERHPCAAHCPHSLKSRATRNATSAGSWNISAPVARTVMMPRR